MKSERKILIAFILNTMFSVFELFGGVFTGSIAIVSDAVHDAGDAASIGISYFLEKKSKKQPDENYTYGYARYSVLGGIITSSILLLGSLAVIVNAVKKIINPTEINSNGMILFAVIGIIVNLTAAIITHNGESLNSKAVNLHMLEDVLGWITVLIGSIAIKLTGFVLIDPIMSIGVAVFICISASKNLKETSEIFLEKTPHNISVKEIKETLCKTEGVIDVHHIHIRTIDGHSNYATMHIVTNDEPYKIKKAIRSKLIECGVSHSTLELETENEHCDEICCKAEPSPHKNHHHH